MVLVSAPLAALLTLAPALGADVKKIEARALNGLWRGQMGGQPAVDLKISAVGNGVVGTATFYVLGGRGKGETSDAPLSDLKFSDGVLSFSVARTGREPLEMRLKLVTEATADLLEGGSGDGPSIAMKKQR